MLLDASADCRSKENEIQKRKKIANKMSAISETQSSFKYRIMSTLINTNLEKRALRQTSINNDFYILEKHYRG